MKLTPTDVVFLKKYRNDWMMGLTEDEFNLIIDIANISYDLALDDALQERQQIGGMKFVDEVDIIKLKKK